MRAHRLARGWTLDHLITAMITATGVGERLVPSRVSRWERDEEEPSALYRDALCRVYQTGPVDLGLARDYRATTDATTRSTTGSEGSHEGPTPAEHVDVPGVRAASLLEKVNALRRRMDETLSGSTLSDTTVAYKEAVANQYGRTYKSEPTAVFLANILADLSDVQVLTDRKLPSSQRRDLCAVTARMAGLVSMTMVNIGRYRDAREWVHTARLAADEAADPGLRAWVATRGAVASLHLGDPEAAAAAAREAEVLTRHHVRDVTAMAWAILARATAVMNQPAAARSALQRAETVYERASSSHGTANNTAYAFTAGQLHFYASHALTTIGETRAARQAQDAALAAFGSHERLDPILVRLDRALCMVQDGDLAGGVDYACTLLLALPDAYRPSIVMRRATAIADAIPPARRTLPLVRTLHDVLALGAAPALP
jgi:hypothetical protein